MGTSVHPESIIQILDILEADEIGTIVHPQSGREAISGALAKDGGHDLLSFQGIQNQYVYTKVREQTKMRA